MNDTTKPAKTAFESLQRWKQKVIDLVIQGDTPTAAVRKIKKQSRRPDVIAAKLKKEPNYLEALDQRRAQAMDDAGITNAQILLGLAQIANGNVKAFVWQEHETLPEGVAVGQAKKLHELDDVTARCVEHLIVQGDGKIEIRWPNRTAAKKLLGQYKRLFTETHEINLGEKTLEQLLEASWNRPRQSPPDEVPPAAGL